MFFSTGEQTTESQAQGSSRSATLRKVHYTLEGERELLINVLQRLGDRRCLLSTAALETRLIETPYVPDSFYAYVVENLPAVLLAMQRERLCEVVRMVRFEPLQLLPATPSVEPDKGKVEILPAEEPDGPTLLSRTPVEREECVGRKRDDDVSPFLD